MSDHEKKAAESADVVAGSLAGDSGFDAAETELLLGLFTEEANELLEEIATGLSALGDEPTRHDLVDDLLRKTHTLKGSAATLGLSTISLAAHALEDVIAKLRSGDLSVDAKNCEGLLEAVDTVRALLDAGDATAKQQLGERLRLELLAVAGAGEGATPDATPRVTVAQEDPASARTPASPLADRSERRVGEQRRHDEPFLRVKANIVDQVMDSVGELVFDRTRLTRQVQELRTVVRGISLTRTELRALAAQIGGDNAGLGARLRALDSELGQHVAGLLAGGRALLDDTQALERTTSGIQEQLTQMRMQPMGQLFQRLARPLREFGRRAGKKVELETRGRGTELDRTMVDHIGHSLVQLLRNAVAHGIEDAELRALRGKPIEGRVVLAARLESGAVVLEVADDGGGVDTAVLREAMVASGRATAAEARGMSESKIINSIFDAGVTSRDDADDLAGRGVGLDAVREHIARLGGEISVVSRPEKGTTFTIRMPVAATLVQAMLFKLDGQVFALPNVHVTETTFVTLSSDGTLPPVLAIGDEPVPVLSLHALLGAHVPTKKSQRPVVVLNYAGRALAVTCDKIVGPREIIIKSLGSLLSPLALYAGATISGSGKVQLILDPAELVRRAYDDTKRPESSASALPRKRVLVVDDSRTVRTSLGKILSSAGFAVSEANDGAEAWHLLQDSDYDLVVTDIEMPRMDGHELVGKIRADVVNQDLPILVITSKDSAETRERVEVEGQSAFLAKPVKQEALLSIVRRLLL